MDEIDKTADFEHLMMPHLDSAHNLARWLAGDEQDAKDIVQEAYLRAFRFFGGFRGGDARAWILAIVRNTTYTWLRKNRSGEAAEFNEENHSGEDPLPDPQKTLIQNATRDAVRAAIEALPIEFREVIILRELEGLSYKQIAEAAAVPIGTVMSRLARARSMLQQRLGPKESKEPCS